MIDTIIFDLGGVLIDWNPAYVFDALITDEKERAYFFDQVCTHDWNEAQDAGRSLADATAERIALFPEWEPHIRAYYGRWTEMLGGAIKENVEIFNELRALPHLRMYALTNWSQETFPVALQRYEFLDRFDGILVSGAEKTRKPFPDIYEKMVERFALDPTSILFIDDSLRNIRAAASAGWDTIHFTKTPVLREALKKRNLA